MANHSPVSKSFTVQVKSLVDDDEDRGGRFEALLSTPDMDLDGDELTSDGWEIPLPARIPINVDHKVGVLTTIGSAIPSLDMDGNLRVEGTFASTPAGQEVRTLVREGHIGTMSVEFLQYWDEDEDGQSKPGKRTLTGGAFTPIPANPKAVVLSAKSSLREDDIVNRLDEIVTLVKSLQAPLNEDSIESNVPFTGSECLPPETTSVADSAVDSAVLVTAVNSADSRDLKTRAKALALLAQAYLSE